MWLTSIHKSANSYKPIGKSNKLTLTYRPVQSHSFVIQPSQLHLPHRRQSPRTEMMLYEADLVTDQQAGENCNRVKKMNELYVQLYPNPSLKGVKRSH